MARVTLYNSQGQKKNFFTVDIAGKLASGEWFTDDPALNTKPGPTPEPVVEEPEPNVEEPEVKEINEVPDLEDMDKEDLESFAKEHFGVDLDRRKSERTLRHDIKTLLVQKRGS